MIDTLKKKITNEFEVVSKTISSDTFTPVALFMKLRDAYTHPVLLESNDFGNKEESHSYIGLEVLASFEVKNGVIAMDHFKGKRIYKDVSQKIDVVAEMSDFVASFQSNTPSGSFNGLFGHTNFDAVQYFDTIKFPKEKRKRDIPDIKYNFYRFILSFNHFKDELTIIENIPLGEQSSISDLESKINNPTFPIFNFKTIGKETSNLTDDEFKEFVRLGKHHCQIGDVFQIVLSRQFQQKFMGDEFAVYRKLRSINPSPYLFYFDYGDYKIFGSSPESQMVIKDGKAVVNPIAGTFKRTGDQVKDYHLGQKLLNDKKEHSEHIMLVDLARNDLSKHTRNVTVKNLMDVQFFSHVIHLVSRVEGDLQKDANTIRVFGDTFPAGTLSGSPKYKAIELINEYENQNRGIYGGAIGLIDLNGNMNQAILIRSFLSHANTLYYQAGAGIVISSDEEKELQEVNHKLNALTMAVKDTSG